MNRTWSFILSCLLTVGGLSSVLAQAESASEPACVAGNAKACFSTGSEYAKGEGVPASNAKALQFFLKVCDKSIPIGCYYGADIYYYGEGDVSENKALAIDLYERACLMGYVDGCNDVSSELKSKTYYDIARLIPVLEVGCARGASNACSEAAFILYNGRDGKYPGHIDFVRAAPLLEKSCADARNIFKGINAYCIFSEGIFSNPESKAFNAAKALHYSQKNCSDNQAWSCFNLGRIYRTIEEFPLAVAAYEKSCKLDATQGACVSIAPTKQYMAEMAAYEAKIAERKATIDILLRDGNFGAAVNMALYQFGSVEYAQMAALAANTAGRMSDISTQDLYALASWFSGGPVRSAADREMANRGTGLEGTYGTGTNQAGAADARWKKQYGSSSPKPSSSGYTGNRPSVLSSSEAASQTREKYRSAHCSMSGNANRNLCR
ncbi:MAG: sel1 repeat family protein [Moraxellaceae bacterium]|nr:sel1 repeat family protein [Moraxellaceae bacterium]HQX90288.1 tetratricopeptide repeat protein [Moraxellaceae bacterium]